MSKSVKKIGSAVVRGVQVTHYRVAVDPARAASSAPHFERAGLRALARRLRVGTIPADVWVDQGNLVRRLRISLRPPAGVGVGSGARIVQTLDFYDFGLQVRVSAPPANEVANISQLTRPPVGTGSGNTGFFSSGGVARPPRVSGSLSPDQALAVGNVARAFWTALGHRDVRAAAQAVLPDQRGCFRALMGTGLPLKVRSLRIVAVRPAARANATVLFNVRASIGGHVIPMLRRRQGHPQWLVATLVNDRWYVNVAESASLAFVSACP